MIPSSTPPRPLRFYHWYSVSLLMLAYVFSFVDRQILYLMIEPIKVDLAITDTQFSLLSGLAFSLFYAVMGLPIAYLSDRYSRVHIIAIGVSFWSLATAACGLSKSFLQMFIARMAVGVGEAALTPASYSMLADLFPREKLGRALGIYSMGAFLGGGAAFLVGGYVIEILRSVPSVMLPLVGEVKPWQLAFIIVGLPGLFVALAILATVREPHRKAAIPSLTPGYLDAIHFLKDHRNTFLCHFLGFAFFAMCQYALVSWAPALYIRKFGLTSSEAGYALGVILLIFSTAGVFTGGWIVDMLQKRGRTDAALISAMIGISGTCLFGMAATRVGDLSLSMMLIAPAMFFSSFPLSTAAAAIQVLAPNHLRAQLSAMFLLVSNIVGMGIGTTLVALLTDKVFGSPKAVDSSMAIILGLASIVCFTLLGCGRKHFRASLNTQAASSCAVTAQQTPSSALSR